MDRLVRAQGEPAAERLSRASRADRHHGDLAFAISTLANLEGLLEGVLIIGVHHPLEPLIINRPVHHLDHAGSVRDVFQADGVVHAPIPRSAILQDLAQAQKEP